MGIGSDYLEVNSPPYLKEDIENLAEGRIDEKQANYLRKKYL